MISYNSSVWEDVFRHNGYDLIVIGAGLVGQSIAHFYAKKHPGSDVLILERGAHPLGASSRNAGFACIGSVTEHLADLELASEEILKDRIRRRYHGLELLKQTLGTEEIEYSEVGGTEIFTDDEVYERAQSQLGRINQWLEEITGQNEVYSSCRINGYPAIFNKVEGMLHSGKMLKRLQNLNQQMGVQYVYGKEVTEIGKDGVVLADGSELKAKRMATATNAFTKQLESGVNIKPGRGYVFVTKEIPDLNWKGTFHYNKGYVYFRNVGENKVLLGGGRDRDLKGEETTEFGINSKIKSYLIDLANDLLKLPEGWEIEKEWSGIMAFTDNHQPIVKSLRDNLVVACGLNGMGVAIGMQVAKEAVEQLN